MASLAESSQATQLLTQALQLGEAGLDLVVQSLHHPNVAIQTAAYHLLSDRPEPSIQFARLWDAPYHALRPQFQVEGRTAGNDNLFAIAPDSQELVVVDFHGTIQVWNLKSGELVGSLPGDGSFGFSKNPYVASKTLGAIAIHPDGQTIWIATANGTIEQRSLTTGESVRTLQGIKHMRSMAIDAAGQLLLVGGNLVEAGVDLWNLTTNTVQAHFKQMAQEVAIAPDGSAIATCSGVSVSLWDTQGNWLRSLPGSRMAFMPDSQTIVTCTAHQVQVWQVQTGELLHQFEEKNSISSLVVSADGQVVVLNCGFVKIRSLATGELLGVVDKDTPYFQPIALSPDSYSLVVSNSKIYVHRNRRAVLLSESTMSDFDRLFWLTNRRQHFDPRFQMAGYTEEGTVRNILQRAAEYGLTIAVDELRRRIKRVEQRGYYRYVLSRDELPMPDREALPEGYRPLNLDRPDIDTPVTVPPSPEYVEGCPYNNTEWCSP
ncbi:hypothetical protein H6F67_07740 [Microcoleus sp. FACHB-1515]|uniref:WD40 repeat domain-containing protein n=1 Tax=Cyanophyceae TaxID=3028117 RepID=UPI001684169D|nr:hypothetical protein [Microcoleus sp. FACHB-1515]MBD2089744.1 hypothetical protein [Microcoleus sp. FACHB-1515]